MNINIKKIAYVFLLGTSAMQASFIFKLSDGFRSLPENTQNKLALTGTAIIGTIYATGKVASFFSKPSSDWLKKALKKARRKNEKHVKKIISTNDNTIEKIKATGQSIEKIQDHVQKTNDITKKIENLEQNCIDGVSQQFDDIKNKINDTKSAVISNIQQNYNDISKHLKDCTTEINTYMSYANQMIDLMNNK